jgi:hypothetical protein
MAMNLTTAMKTIHRNTTVSMGIMMRSIMDTMIKNTAVTFSKL